MPTIKWTFMKKRWLLPIQMVNGHKLTLKPNSSPIFSHFVSNISLSRYKIFITHMNCLKKFENIYTIEKMIENVDSQNDSNS